MPTWVQRSSELAETLALLPAGLNGAETADEQLHLELLRLEVGTREPLEPQKRLRTAAFSPDDFPSLSTLSSTGSFAHTELVRPSSSLFSSSGTSGTVYVAKTVERRWAFRMREQQSVGHEVAILRLGLSSSSPSPIPRLIASFLSPTSFHIILEHAAGGDLWTVLERQNEGVEPGSEVGLREDWVRFWMAQLVEAVEWLHEKGWAHRDIKPQNLLLQSSGHLLLTDFGSAAPLSPGSSSAIARKYCRALVGTPDYIAPEVLEHAEKVFEENEAEEEDEFDEGEGTKVDPEEGAYGAEVDVWACGVVMYELLSGKAPFFAEEISDTYERIRNYSNFLSYPSILSSPAQQMLESLLVAPEARPSWAQVKRLSWFSSVDWKTLREATPPHIPTFFTAPPSSPSFSRSQQSFNQSLDYSSFFSSPGLSILRPSPRTADAGRREEREYWEAKSFGGLTTLPSPGEFDRPSSYPTPFPVSFVSSSNAVDRSTTSHSAFETPARPFFRPPRHLPHPASFSSAPHAAATASATPLSSGRSRRMISEMDAWKEMQEHAWIVGTSARKERRKSADGGALGLAVERLSMQVTKADVELSKGGEGKGEKLGGLEKRQKEMVDRLAEMDRKYEDLFKLAATAI